VNGRDGRGIPQGAKACVYDMRGFPEESPVSRVRMLPRCIAFEVSDTIYTDALSKK
jgi:hypothetical protein